MHVVAKHVHACLSCLVASGGTCAHRLSNEQTAAAKHHCNSPSGQCLTCCTHDDNRYTTLQRLLQITTGVCLQHLMSKATNSQEDDQLSKDPMPYVSKCMLQKCTERSSECTWRSPHHTSLLLRQLLRRQSRPCDHHSCHHYWCSHPWQLLLQLPHHLTEHPSAALQKLPSAAVADQDLSARWCVQ